MTKYAKIVVYVPSSHGNAVRKALAESGCGGIGKYDNCSFTVKGIGRFRANKNANPFIGKKGVINKIAEERIETVCPKNKLKSVLKNLKKTHPYEEPAIDVYALMDF